jgi:hypothetical protein
MPTSSLVITLAAILRPTYYNLFLFLENTVVLICRAFGSTLKSTELRYNLHMTQNCVFCSTVMSVRKRQIIQNTERL